MATATVRSVRFSFALLKMFRLMVILLLCLIFFHGEKGLYLFLLILNVILWFN